MSVFSTNSRSTEGWVLPRYESVVLRFVAGANRQPVVEKILIEHLTRQQLFTRITNTMPNLENLLKNKPLELVDALFRVASLVRQPKLKSRLENWGITFLESYLLQETKSISRDVHILGNLIIFGESIGEIPYHISQAFHAQFEQIKAAIRQFEDGKVAEFSVASLFGNSNSYGEAQDGSIYYGSKPNQDGVPKRSELDQIVPDISSSIVRRDLIARKIRQLGNAAMKDLIAVFPSVSERTLRYDLQRLCEQSILERMGNGGPASYYRLKVFVPEQTVVT